LTLSLVAVWHRVTCLIIDQYSVQRWRSPATMMALIDGKKVVTFNAHLIGARNFSLIRASQSVSPARTDHANSLSVLCSHSAGRSPNERLNRLHLSRLSDAVRTPHSGLAGHRLVIGPRHRALALPPWLLHRWPINLMSSCGRARAQLADGSTRIGTTADSPHLHLLHTVVQYRTTELTFSVRSAQGREVPSHTDGKLIHSIPCQHCLTTIH